MNNSVQFNAPQSGLGTMSPEQLVGYGFRSWIQGYQTNNFDYWRQTWEQFSKALGAEAARATISDLAFWVQTMQQVSSRLIKVSEKDCHTFSQDERIAITMIAASQHNACPALSVCAYTLLGECELEPVIKASNNFASQLMVHDLCLTNAFSNPVSSSDQVNQQMQIAV